MNRMYPDDPILTAYALGEPLTDEQRATVEALLASSAEARAWVEETRAFAGVLAVEFKEELENETVTREEEPKVVPMPRVAKPGAGRRALWGVGISAAAAVVTISFLLNQPVPVVGLKEPLGMDGAEASTPVPVSTPIPPAVVVPAPSSDRSDLITPLPGDAASVIAKAARTAGEAAGRPVVSPPATPEAPAPADLRKVDREGMAKVIGSFSVFPEPSMVRASAATASKGKTVITRGARALVATAAPQRGERYRSLPENRMQQVSEAPLSTFSLDVDTASYANVRRMLRQGMTPPPGAVRIEEMINYFRYDDPPPESESAVPLAIRVESAEAPWEPRHRLVRIGVRAREIDRSKIEGVNLVFLIDTSGSMASENKLPLLKSAFETLLRQLRDSDRISLITYAGEAQVVLEATPVSERETIRRAIERLQAGGSTNGSGGIEAAYKAAGQAFIKDGVNRVILATDGDFNVGLTGDADLQSLIERKAGEGVYLSILGFGTGNINDATMKLLSTKGNGNYAYIDSAREAEKVLGREAAGTLFTVAKDVKMQVEFNPATVASYRLIGYENRLLTKEDFNDDRKDAGDVGAGHRVTALYEVVPVEAVGTAPTVDPLKYQPQPATPEAKVKPAAGSPSAEWLTVKLRYKEPEGGASKLMEVPFTDSGTSLEKSSADLRFSAAVAQYGMWLSGSTQAGVRDWDALLALAEGAMGEDPDGTRAEFLELIQLARKQQ